MCTVLCVILGPAEERAHETFLRLNRTAWWYESSMLQRYYVKPMVLDWALLSEVSSAVFVQMQPQLVIHNLLSCDSHTCKNALVSTLERKENNFSMITENVSIGLLGVLC